MNRHKIDLKKLSDGVLWELICDAQSEKCRREEELRNRKCGVSWCSDRVGNTHDRECERHRCDY